MTEATKCQKCGNAEADVWHRKPSPGPYHAFVPASQPSETGKEVACTCREAPSGEEGHAPNCELRKANAALTSTAVEPDGERLDWEARVQMLERKWRKWRDIAEELGFERKDLLADDEPEAKS